MSSGKNCAGKGKAQHNTPTKQQQHQQQQQQPPPQQILALLLIQDSPQTRASFRHTLQWLIHPVLKNIASSSTPPPITLLTGIIVYSANHIHTIPFQPALEFLKTCAANARFPFTSHPPTSVQEDDDDELFQSLLSPPTPPASPPQSTTAATATATAESQQRPSRRSDTVNIANVLSAVLHMFQERSPSSTAVDPTNPLPSQYPPTHSRHLIHISSMTTPLSFNCNPTTNIASAYDAMDALALAHEFSKLRSLSPSQSIEDPSAPTTTPELAITSIVLRAPHIQRSSHHTPQSIAPSTQPPDSQRLHWLLALSLASHDPLTAMAEVDELAPTLSDIFDNPRDILTADEHDSLMAYFQPPPSGPGAQASSSTSPLVLFSNFLTAVRASREAASSRSAESLVHRKRSLDALRAGSTSSAAYNPSQSQQQQQQTDSTGPAAKRQKMDKDTPAKAKGDAPPAKPHTHSRSASNATASGPTADPAGHAAGVQASQLQQNKPGQPNLSPGLASVNFPAHITPGERAKIQFLHQQHAHMLKNLATIQQRITQEQQQQQQPTTAQDEEKRKVTLAQAQAQVQKVAQVRAKILGEQKALHASIVALTTPPVNKSASLDQASLPVLPTVNINENFRRTLDIDTHARTLGLNLGGFSEQFHAQIQVASAKQQQQQQALHQQQQMFMQQQKQQQQQAAAAALAQSQSQNQNQGRQTLPTTEGGGQPSQQGQAGGHSGSGGPGGGIAPPTQQQQQQAPQAGPHRPSAFWSGAMTFLMPGVSNGAAPLATMVSASCPTTRNEGDLLMPWPRQLQLSTMIPISMRDLQTLASSRSSPIPCVLFSTLPVPAAASATAQLQADMQVQNEKIYFQLARLLELKKMGALISLQPKGSAKAASEDPEKVGPGLLLIGVPPPGGGANAAAAGAGGEGQPPSSSMATAPKLLGMVLKEAVPKALLCGAQAAGAANAVSISASGPRAAPTTTAAGKGGTNTGTPASSYIGSTFGSAPAPSSLAGSAPGSVMAQNLGGAAGQQQSMGGGAGMNFPFGGGGGGNTGVNPAAMAAAAAAVAAAARQQSHPQQQQQMQYLNNAAQGQGQGQIPPQGPMYNNNNMGNQGQQGPPQQQQTGQFVMPFGYNGGLGGAVGAAGGGGGVGGGPGGGMMAPFGGGGGGGGNSQPSLGGGVGQAQQQQQQQQAPFMQPGHGLGLGPGPGGGGGMMSGMGGGGGDGNGGAGAGGGAGGMGGGGMGGGSGAGVDIGALARMMGLGG